MRLKTIVDHLESHGIHASVQGDPEVEITQIAALKQAVSGEISFLSDKKRIKELATTQASVVILQTQYADQCNTSCLIVDDPYYAYARVAQLLNPDPTFSPGVDSMACVSETALISEGVCIQSHVVIGEGVQIGKGTLVMSGTVIQPGCVIGEHCRIGPSVVIMHECEVGHNTRIEAGTVIGGDGFGWANHQGSWIKIPQIGRVVVGDHVSIGNNCTIDRGAIEDTVIEKGCIIDNQVHIAHNVCIGEGSAIAAQTGFAGSTTLGRGCTVAGQVGFSGHIALTDGVHIMAKSGVTRSVNKPGVYAGFPLLPVEEWQKNNVRAKQLDKMARQIRAMEQELNALKQKQ